MKIPLTPLDFIERARRVYGSLEAVVDGDRRFTYIEFAERCHRLAHGLRSLGCRPGDRIAYVSGNMVELLEAYYGVVLAGCILTPLNIRLAPMEMQEVIDDCDPALLVVHPRFAEIDLHAKQRLEIGDDYDDLLAAQPDGLFEPEPFGEDDVCELFYTSGSTAGPKGAMLTHRNLATHALDAALSMGVGHRDTVLHNIPLFHVNGWGTPHWVTALGGRHVMIDRFEPPEVLRLIEDERVTRLHLVPTMANSLLTCPDIATRDLSSVVGATVGGAPAGYELIAALDAALPNADVICGYGLTEASPQLTKALTLRSHDSLPVDEQRRRRATAGIPNLGVDLRVLDDDGAEVPWDGASVGEVCVRSNHVMAGYWNKPQETADALRDGWLRTGDLATIDSEGYINIVDRKKDIIVSGGENISSLQVEQALCAHPSVLEAAVVGMPHERWGEVPRAFVVLRPGADPANEGELIEWVRGRLAHFKAPKRIEIMADLPKGGTGKVQKRALRDLPLSP